MATAAAPKAISLDYVPRPQFLPFHNRRHRWAVLNTHRRAGKTVALVNDMVVGALQCPLPNPQMAYIGPTFAQAKRVAWRYLKDAARPLLAKPPQESELKITLKTGATIYVLGADNADSLRGMYLDGAMMDEYAMFRPTVFSTVIRPALSDRHGWGVFASTPRGKNLFYDTYRKAEQDPAEWYSLTLKASTSGLIAPEELRQLQRDMDPEEYAQEYECSFDAALKGAIYADQVNSMFADGRVVNEDIYDPTLPLHWAFDIGMTDATVATAFQIRRDNTVAVCNVYVTHGVIVMEHIERVANFKGRLGSVWLPHDAKQANDQTGMSVVEQFAKEFRKMPERNRPRLRGVPMHKVRDGLAAARAVFPRVTICEPLTGEMVEALKAYRRQWDDTLLMFRDQPVHDWACFVPGTRVATPQGPVAIEKVQVGDMVTTPAGPRRVLHTAEMEADRLVEIVFTNGKTVTCTANHKWFTQRGLVQADSLRYTDTFFTGGETAWQWIKWISKAAGITGLGRAISSFARPESSGARGSAPGCSTRTSGPVPTGLFHRALRYITGMGTRVITPWEISSFWIEQNTASCTATGARLSPDGAAPRTGATSQTAPASDSAACGRPTESTCSPTRKPRWLKRAWQRLSGTAAPKGGSGTGPSTSPRSHEPLRSRLASSAVRTILRNLPGASSAVGVVRLRRFAADGQRVYDLTVEGENCFIANGVLTSNSDYADSFRYMCIAVGIMDSEGGYGATVARDPDPTAPDPLTGIPGLRIRVHTDMVLEDLFAQNEAKPKILRIS